MPVGLSLTKGEPVLSRCGGRLIGFPRKLGSALTEEKEREERERENERCN